MIVKALSEYEAGKIDGKTLGILEERKKRKKQGLIVTMGQLYRLLEDLEEEFEWKDGVKYCDEERKFQINIINNTPECSDTWEIDSQDKNAIAISDGNAEKGTASLPIIGQNLDTDNLRNPVLDTATPLEGCRKNPQDCSGVSSGLAKEDTDDSILPVGFKSKLDVEKTNVEDKFDGSDHAF